MERWSEYGLILLWFAVPAGVLASLLALGLRAHRETPIPLGWWPLLVVAAASQTGIGALAVALMADHPGIRHQHSRWEFLLGYAAIAGLVGPMALIPTTIYWSHHRGIGWMAGVVGACLLLVLVTLAAVLSAAQMVSGAPL